MSDIIKITIKSGSGYGLVDDAYDDKLVVTSSSISYEYKPHPMSNSETNIYRKWSYKTTSPLFSAIFRRVAEMTPRFLYIDEDLFCTDIGPTVITARVMNNSLSVLSADRLFFLNCHKISQRKYLKCHSQQTTFNFYAVNVKNIKCAH